MIRTHAAPLTLAILVIAGCGGGDPLREQLRSDIRRAEAESTYDFREGFVSRWGNSGEPKYASCVILGFRTFRNAKIYPHGGPSVSIGLGDDFREQGEWREYCFQSDERTRWSADREERFSRAIDTGRPVARP